MTGWRGGCASPGEDTRLGRICSSDTRCFHHGYRMLAETFFQIAKSLCFMQVIGFAWAEGNSKRSVPCPLLVAAFVAQECHFMGSALGQERHLAT